MIIKDREEALVVMIMFVDAIIRMVIIRIGIIRTGSITDGGAEGCGTVCTSR